MLSVFFAANPAVLDKLNYSLRVDERVLRYKVFKQRSLPKYPSPYYVGKALRLGYADKLKAKFDPITNGFPHAAWRALTSHMPPGRLEPGSFGQLAREATAALAGQTIETQHLLGGGSGRGVLPPAGRGGLGGRQMHTVAGGVHGSGVHGSFAASGVVGYGAVIGSDHARREDDVVQVPPPWS